MTKTDKKAPCMREFILLILNKKGQEFSAEELAGIRVEDDFIKNMTSSTSASEEAKNHAFNQQKRGTVYDYLKMAVSIMEAPKPEARGISRKDGETYDSLLEKLWEAEDAHDAGNRPVSIMLDEGEYKHLKERVLANLFPNRGRAVTRFQNDVENIPKVEVAKVEGDDSDPAPGE